jgi:single-strand DNA-binding protein
MDGLNQVTLIGSVGKDAEVKVFGENSQVAKFSVATNRSYKDKNGVKQTQTEWHNIEVWAETAKFAGTYVKKGNLVLVLGEIRYEKFDDKDGKPQQRTKIVANKIQLFPKGGATGSEKGEVNTATKQTEEYATQTSQEFVGSSSNVDDDLPF